MKWIERDLGDLDTAYIYPIGDLHVGDPLFNEKKFKEFVKIVESTNNAYLILMGDLLDCATKDSVGDTYSAMQNPQQAKKYLIELLQPIKDRILGVVQGNHEYRIWKTSGIDVSEDIATALECPYNREGLLLNIRLGHTHNPNNRQNYTIYATHGVGAGRTVGSKANVMKRASDNVLANIYVIGHTHQPNVFPDVYHIPDVIHKKVVPMARYYVNGGSFLNWGGYAESKMYPATPIVTVTIILSGTSKSYKCIV
jgi:predicted phosphodiesterase